MKNRVTGFEGLHVASLKHFLVDIKHQL